VASKQMQLITMIYKKGVKKILETIPNSEFHDQY